MKTRTRKRKAGKNRGAGRKASLHGDIASWLRHDWVLGLLLLLAVILVYQSVWSAGFIWDDDMVLTSNPVIVGSLGLKEIWTTSAAQFYPLVLTSLWVEHALWGLAPWPYHLVNVLQHGLSAVLLWRVLRSLQIPGAWLGAALWALHPVQVESVAWITEMKNTQSTLFYLLSILFFLKGLKNPGTWNYAFTLLFAAMAMASKSSTVVLPVVLGLCAWWVEGRWRWRNLAGLIPIFLMSVASSVITLWSLASDKTANPDPQEARGWLERVAAAGDVVWFYPGKLLWPHPLLTVYPRWQIDAGQWFSYLPLAAAIIVLFVLWLKRESPCRPLFFAFAYFLTALLPFLGLIDQGFWRYSFVADHFQYLADMGPLALAGAGIVWLSDFVLPGKAWLVSTLGTGLLLVLGLLSWQQARIYKNEETLWSHTLNWNPHCWAGYNNLGNALLQKRQVNEAIVQFQKALAIDPNFAQADYNLGNALLEKGQVDEAIVQFQKALKINSNYVDAHNNLGDALFKQGQIDGAISQYQKALAIDPNFAQAHYNLGIALFQKGQTDEAIGHFQKALAIDPNHVDAHNSLGIALTKKRQVDQATIQFQKTLAIDPNHAQAHYNLGLALFQKGQTDEAIGHFQKALEIDPAYVEAHNNLGNAFFQKGQLDEAIVQFQKALAIDPNHAQADYNLGNAFFQKGQMDEAIVQFQKALTIDPNHAQADYNLGNALFQKGQTDEAIVRYKKALEIDRNLVEARNNLGIALVKKGELGEAVAQFKEAVRLKSDYRDAQNNLAKVEAMARSKTSAK